MDLKNYLDKTFAQFNTDSFIADDPISIPHLFVKLQDVEISAFFAATLAWGQRKTIIAKCKELMQLMDNAPHDFVLHHTENDLKTLLNFKHRTFNTTDLLYFVQFFQAYYTQHHSLETAFAQHLSHHDQTVERALIGFYQLFFSLPDAPQRTQKHVASPERKSACKRINMFLRWMVRQDEAGVDFGLWKNISPAQLICPLDLHVERTARQLGLLKRTQVDWQAALELTDNLRQFCHEDPVRYDFALFGISVNQKST